MSKPDNSLLAEDRLGRDAGQILAVRNFLEAFAACKPRVRQLILRLLKSMNDADMDDFDRQTATETITDALFPRPNGDGSLDIDLQEAEDADRNKHDEAGRIITELDAEEELFRDRLTRIMGERGITQADLAVKMGVGQPAVSMLLNRKTRPQQRTIARLASALGVLPNDLWPAESV